jgi:thioredoxin-related protein
MSDIKRRIFLAGVLSLLCAYSFGQVFWTLEILSYEDAVILSKEQDKKLFLLFGADYCGWCHKQKQVLMDQEVLGELQNYIVCFVDKTQREDLSKKYEVKSIPAYFVIKNDKVLKKSIGYKDKEGFLNWLSGVKKTLLRR